MNELHPALARDTLPLSTLPGGQLRLMNDRRYPWLILVPDQPGITDWDQLPSEAAAEVWGGVGLASRLLRELFHPDKLNIASLGNMVPQLHIHIIARFRGDDAWPRPVWGQHPPLPYDPAAAEELTARLRERLESLLAAPGR